MEKNVVFEKTYSYETNEIKPAVLEFFKFRTKISLILSIIFILLGIAFTILTIIIKGDTTTFASSLIIVGAGLFLLFFIIILYIKTKNKKYNPVEYSYIFYDDSLLIDFKTENMNNHLVLKYSDIFKVVRLKNYTYIFIDKNQAYFISNDSYDNEFYSFLKNKINRFKG